MLRTIAIASLSLFATGAVYAQTAESLPSFDVASIKPAAPMAPGRMMIGFRGGPGTGDPGQMTFNNVSLKDLIQAAWDVKAYQITGPSWLESERFDVTAKVPKGATKEQSRLMLQNLLEDRFKLKLHHSTREQPIYALMVAKNGPKLKESVEDPNAPPAPDFPLADGGGGKAVQRADGGPVIGKGDTATGPPSPPRGPMRMMVNNGRMKMASDGQTMARFVDMLGTQVDRPVVDMTGLKGNYDISLEFAPDMALMQSKMAALGAPPPGPAAGRGGSDADSPDAQNAPGIFTALQEQLGLRLDPKKRKGRCPAPPGNGRNTHIGGGADATRFARVPQKEGTGGSSGDR